MKKIITSEAVSLPEGCPVIVTGATGGIGAEIVRGLACIGIPMILPCRNKAKFDILAEALRSELPDADIRYIPLDLNDSHSVTEAVTLLKGMPLAGIINNAGIMCRDFSLSPDGPETTLNVNYFNTKLFNLLLLPQVCHGGAIVFTTSITRKTGRQAHLPESVTERTFGQLRTYSLSKKLITRFAQCIAAKAAESGVRVNCCDPGVVDSGMITMHRWYDPLANIFFRPFIRTARNGAVPALRALFSPETGKIFTLRAVRDS